jgi:hypothetical protein
VPWRLSPGSRAIHGVWHAPTTRSTALRTPVGITWLDCAPLRLRDIRVLRYLGTPVCLNFGAEAAQCWPYCKLLGSNAQRPRRGARLAGCCSRSSLQTLRLCELPLEDGRATVWSMLLQIHHGARVIRDCGVFSLTPSVQLHQIGAFLGKSRLHREQGAQLSRGKHALSATSSSERRVARKCSRRDGR